MKLLAIDTSTKVAGAALVEDGRLICELNLACGLTHSERLMPLVDDCLRLAGWKPADLGAVAAVAGPGSFTGVRIGVSTAKGIAEALGVPVVSVGTLETLAASFVGFGGVIVPILDARRDQVYCAVYGADGSELAPPAAMALGELLALPQVSDASHALFAGDGVPVHWSMIQSTLGEKARCAPEHLLLQRAGAAAMLAWNKLMAGQTLDAADLLPEYLRKSSAEQVKERREGAAHAG